MNHFKSDQCPVCVTEIEKDFYSCDACETNHHIDCWKESDGCARYACESPFGTEYRNEKEFEPVLIQKKKENTNYVKKHILPLASQIKEMLQFGDEKIEKELEHRLGLLELGISDVPVARTARKLYELKKDLELRDFVQEGYKTPNPYDGLMQLEDSAHHGLEKLEEVVQNRLSELHNVELASNRAGYRSNIRQKLSELVTSQKKEKKIRDRIFSGSIGAGLLGALAIDPILFSGYLAYSCVLKYVFSHDIDEGLPKKVRCLVNEVEDELNRTVKPALTENPLRLAQEQKKIDEGRKKYELEEQTRKQIEGETK